MSAKNQNKPVKYLSLQNAAKMCPYSQEYLSLRARQKKLKAVKKGRNWVTTADWLNSYVAEIGNKKEDFLSDIKVNSAKRSVKGDLIRLTQIVYFGLKIGAKKAILIKNKLVLLSGQFLAEGVSNIKRVVDVAAGYSRRGGNLLGLAIDQGVTIIAEFPHFLIRVTKETIKSTELTPKRVLNAVLVLALISASILVFNQEARASLTNLTDGIIEIVQSFEKNGNVLAGNVSKFISENNQSRVISTQNSLIKNKKSQIKGVLGEFRAKFKEIDNFSRRTIIASSEILANTTKKWVSRLKIVQVIRKDTYREINKANERLKRKLNLKLKATSEEMTIFIRRFPDKIAETGFGLRDIFKMGTIQSGGLIKDSVGEIQRAGKKSFLRFRVNIKEFTQKMPIFLNKSAVKISEFISREAPAKVSDIVRIISDKGEKTFLSSVLSFKNAGGGLRIGFNVGLAGLLDNFSGFNRRISEACDKVTEKVPQIVGSASEKISNKLGDAYLKMVEYLVPGYSLEEKSLVLSPKTQKQETTAVVEEETTVAPAQTLVIEQTYNPTQIVVKEVVSQSQTQPHTITETTKRIIETVESADLSLVKADISRLSQQIVSLGSQIGSKINYAVPSYAPVYIPSAGIEVSGHSLLSTLNVSGSGAIGGSLAVKGNTGFGSPLDTTDTMTVDSDATFNNPITVAKTLTAADGVNVTGGSLTVGAFSVNSATGSVTGNLSITGNVGIGTTTPSSAFVVTAPAGNYAGDQALFTVASTTSATSNNLLVITADGNVGIATTTPDSKLTVNGKIDAVNSSEQLRLSHSDLANKYASFTIDANGDLTINTGGSAAVATTTFTDILKLTYAPQTAGGVGANGLHNAALYINADDTGPAADANLLSIANSGVYRFRVDAEGDVFVAGNITTEGVVTQSGTDITGNLTVEGYSLLGDAPNNDYLEIKGYTTIRATSTNPALMIDQSSTGGLLTMKKTGSEVFTIDNNGNATTTGGTFSIIDSSESSYYKVGQANENSIHLGWIYNATAANGYGVISTYANSNPIYYAAQSHIFSNGNLGIGTTTPNAKLDIAAGNINLSSTTAASPYGMITKEGVRFIHNFNYGNNGSYTTEGQNTFVGESAGNTTMGSTAAGVYESSYNTGVGYWALKSNARGYNNVAVGTKALYVNTSGKRNVAVGSGAMGLNTIGSNNSGFGDDALTGNTEGGYNSAFGWEAGRYISGGSVANTTGDYNIFLGASTKALADNDQNEIVIGYNATGLGSNTVVLGNESITTTALRGNVGIGTTTPWGKLSVHSVSANTAPLFVVASTTPNLVGTTTAFIIDKDGNVGIGTGTPGAKLTISSGDIAISSGSYLRLGGAGASTFLQNDGSNNLEVRGYNNVEIVASNGGSGNITMTGGNVGIGTTTPWGKLSVHSVSANAAPLFVVASSTPNLVATTTAFIINKDGNVGIGTGSPAVQLDIKGLSTEPTYGSTLLTNGDFATGDFTGWTAGANWSVVSNAALHTAGDTATLAQTISVTSGVTYQIEWTDTSTAGSYTFTIGSVVSRAYSYWEVAGAKRATIVASGTGSQTFSITPSSTYDGSIDNVTVRAISSFPSAIARLQHTDGTSALEIRSGGAGLNNTFIGLNAGRYNTTGYNNNAIGSSALSANTTGYNNNAIGSSALSANTTGYYNNAIGSSALSANTTGYYNIAMGTFALIANTTGYNNNAIGSSALAANTTGYYNIAMGTSALYANTTGYANIAVGRDSGRYIADGATANATGNNSLFFGYNTRALADGQTNQIVIGYNATGLGSNSVVLGNESITTTALRGNVGIATTTPWGRLSVFGTSANDTPLFVVASSTPDGVLATSTALIVDAYGNVGIGTETPGAKLTISSGDIAISSGSYLRLGGAGASTFLQNDGSNNLEVRGYNNVKIVASNGGSGNITMTGGNVGIGTTTPYLALSIHDNTPTQKDLGVFNGAICADNNGTAKCYGTLTAGTIYGDDSSIGASDFAENYPIMDESIEAGDVVVISSEELPAPQKEEMDNQEIDYVQEMLRTTIAKSQKGYDDVIGVVSTHPGVLLGDITGLDLKTKVRPVALSGRVPVKVNLDGGSIKIGDPLTSASSTPGYAMKAAQKGRIIGFALEEFNEVSTGDKIMVFLDLGWNGTELTVEQDGDELVLGEFDQVILTNEKGEKVYLTLDNDGFVVIDKIKAKMIETEQLCVGGVCVNQEQLKQLLESVQEAGESSVAPIIIEEPEPESEPEPEPAVEIPVEEPTEPVEVPAEETIVEMELVESEPTEEPAEAPATDESTPTE